MVVALAIAFVCNSAFNEYYIVSVGQKQADTAADIVTGYMDAYGVAELFDSSNDEVEVLSGHQPKS